MSAAKKAAAAARKLAQLEKRMEMARKHAEDAAKVEALAKAAEAETAANLRAAGVEVDNVQAGVREGETRSVAQTRLSKKQWGGMGGTASPLQ